LSASWSWQEKSKAHRERFQKFLEYGQEHPEEIKEINGVRFCCSSEEFCIGRGGDGTRVYIGLGKDGCEKAVKRLHKDECGSLAKQEKQILNESNMSRSIEGVDLVDFLQPDIDLLSRSLTHQRKYGGTKLKTTL
jgi:hypothetical protein